MNSKRIIIYILCLFLGIGKLFAQSEEEGKDSPSPENAIQCATPLPKEYEEFNNEKSVNPELLEQARKFIEQKTEEFSDPSFDSRYRNCIKLKCDYTIPVIVHVIHDGEPIGTGANISYKQILSQIAALNDVFNDKSGGCGANVRINFCLATLDPKNNALLYPGVERILANPSWEADYSSTWMYLMVPNSSKYISIATFEGSVIPTTIWNPKQYLNIWTCNSPAKLFNGFATDVSGYSYFPANAQLPAIDLAPNSAAAGSFSTLTKDGIIMNAEAFTSVRFGGPAPQSLNQLKHTDGDVLAHEVGHWLGLRHVNGDDPNCGVDDGCLDTYECTSLTGGCSVAAECNMPAYPVENYMAYTDDACRSQFTFMQAARMRQALMVDDMRRFLPCSDKCSATNCFVVADFTSKIVGSDLVLENTSPIASGSTILALDWQITNLFGTTTSISYAAPNTIPYLQNFRISLRGSYTVCLHIVIVDAYGNKCEDKICKKINPCEFSLKYNLTAVANPNNSRQFLYSFSDASTPTPNLLNWWHYNLMFFFHDCTVQSFDGYTANSNIFVVLQNSINNLSGYIISMEAGVKIGKTIVCQSAIGDTVGTDCNNQPLSFRKQNGGLVESLARLGLPKLDPKLLDNTLATLAVFPSPTKDELNIELKGKIISRVEIIDMNGKSIKTQSLKSDSKELMNVKELSAGTYIIRVTDSNEKSYTNKFIKQ